LVSLSWLAVERAGPDHLGHSGRRVVGWLTFWLGDLSLDDLLQLVGEVRAVDDSLLDGWLSGFSSQFFGSLKGSSKNRNDRVLRGWDDLVDLRRDQTRAVEDIVGDLGPHPVRHLRVVQPLKQLPRHVVGAHDQPLCCTAPDLRRGAAVLVADHSAVLGLPFAPAAVGSRAVAADDRLGK
jgi:hypothetical protein